MYPVCIINITNCYSISSRFIFSVHIRADTVFTNYFQQESKTSHWFNLFALREVLLNTHKRNTQLFSPSNHIDAHHVFHAAWAEDTHEPLPSPPRGEVKYYQWYLGLSLPTLNSWHCSVQTQLLTKLWNTNINAFMYKWEGAQVINLFLPLMKRGYKRYCRNNWGFCLYMDTPWSLNVFGILQL